MENLITQLFPNWKLFNVNETVLLFVLLVVPGFVVIFVRSKFITGRIPEYPAGFLAYLTVSTIYWAVVAFLLLPLAQLVVEILRLCFGLWIDGLLLNKYILNCGLPLFLVVLFPALIGLGFGVVSKKYWVYGVLKTLGLNPVHPTPSAWDWTFEDLGEKFILVQLKNGSYFGGLMGLDSFVSSDPSERDIYVQEIYHIDDEGNWKSQNHGALIASGEVSTIEFWPYQIEREG